MSEPLLDLLLAVVVVFGLNVLPAFAPPTWTVLVFFVVTTDVPSAALVVCGALAAAAGRYVLARLSRRFGAHLPERKRADMQAVGDAINARAGSRWALMGFFVVSPLPSAQLFVAAGLTPGTPLGPLTLAFLVGRLGSYTLYVGGATVAERSLDRLLADKLTSPGAIAFQVAMLALLAGFVLTPWAKILGRRRDGDDPPAG